MSSALFRVRLADGSARWGLGEPASDPERLLPASLTLDALLARPADAFWDAVSSAQTSKLPDGWRCIAPIESQPVWAAGVTYAPSREARKAESIGHALAYEQVFGASRPELFFKAEGGGVRGPGESVSVRSDSTWNVPEPEVALILTSSMEIAAVTVGNDVSSRSIEGANPLYLPQAKVYDGSCALGPCLVPPLAPEALTVRLRVVRSGGELASGSVSAATMVRSFSELASWLGRGVAFPVGVVLLTGTGIVPPPEVSLMPGDDVSIEIEGIGVLRNVVRMLEAGAAPEDETPEWAPAPGDAGG